MQKGEATKLRILETAADLIHQHGMNVVSIGDVLKASGTGKSQFYSHFKSREDMVTSVLRWNEERICKAFSAPIESWEDVHEWIFGHSDRIRGVDFQRGCPFGTAAYSLLPSQDEERKPLKRMLDAIRERLIEFLERENQAGKLREDASPKALASFSVATIQGALIIGLVEKNDESMEAALRECYTHLESFRIK